MHVQAAWGLIKAEWKTDKKINSLTFISVCHKNTRHEFLLAVRAKGVSDHDLVLRQLALQLQSILPVELDFSCQKRNDLKTLKPLLKICSGQRKHNVWNPFKK